MSDGEHMGQDVWMIDTRYPFELHPDWLFISHDPSSCF